MVARSSTVKQESGLSNATSVDDAVTSGLHYAIDNKPGIQRRSKGNGFTYIGVDGKVVKEVATLKRIRSLVIPPAWKEVWICPDEKGHIQVTGRDSRNRKQYRYHPRWREHRDASKFSRLAAFAVALPRIRNRVRRDLSKSGMPREKVIAAVVRLLETTLIRVGNTEYSRQNGSYGLTTMRNHHAQVSGARMKFSFRGKSGVRHVIGMEDRKLAAIVRRCQDLPGQQLFVYVDEEGQPHEINSRDVNEYLRSIAGHDFTAKDFRTWAGTVLTAVALCEIAAADTPTEAKRNLVSVIESVSHTLGNTPSVCRRCYIHPAVLDFSVDTEALRNLRQRFTGSANRNLKPIEQAVQFIVKRDPASKRSRNRAGRA